MCQCKHIMREFYSTSKYTDPSVVYPLTEAPPRLCKRCFPVWLDRSVHVWVTTWRELGTYFQIRPWPVEHYRTA